MSDNYLNPFGSNNISNISPTTSSTSIDVVDNSNASIMANNSSSTMNYILSPSDLTEADFELIKKELERKIQEQKNDLKNAKNTRGWATSAWNGIKGWFGGGDKKAERNISNYEDLLGGLNSDISNIDEVYKTIMGSDLDLASLQTLKSSEAIANSIDSETQEAIVAELENQLAVLESNFETALNSNGWISGTWNAFKNWTGIGASSNKTSAEIDDLKEQIKKLKNGEADLATTFKNITGNDLNAENLTLLLSGEVGTGLDSISTAGQSVNAYSEGQKMCTDIVADMVSGIAAVGIVAFGTAIGVCAAPFTAGASLGLVAAGIGMAAGTGALVKTAIKASDCIGNKKTYSFEDFKYDALTGGINGAAAPLTNALGGATGTAVMKWLGMEALETTVKSGALIAAKEVAEEVIEESAEQAGKKLVSTGLAKTISFISDSVVDGSTSGFIDNSSRAFAEGRYEDILSDGWDGFKGGLLAAPLMNAGFNFAGKAGSRLGQTVLGQTTGKMAKEGFQALGNVIDSILPQGVKRILQESGEKLNSRFVQTSLKNCLTISDDGIYSVRANGYNIQLVKSELSDEILEAISKGDNTLVYNYAQDVLTFELRKQELFKINFLGDDEANVIATLGEKDYQRAMSMLKNDADPIGISRAIENLDPSLHSRALDMIADGTNGNKIKYAVDKLDPNLHSKALDMIEAGFTEGQIDNLIMLDNSQFEKVLTMLSENNISHQSIGEAISNVDPSLQTRVLDMISKGISSEDINNAVKNVEPSMHTRALDALENGEFKKNIHTALKEFSKSKYPKEKSDKYVEMLNKLSKEIDDFYKVELLSFNDQTTAFRATSHYTSLDNPNVEITKQVLIYEDGAIVKTNTESANGYSTSWHYGDNKTIIMNFKITEETLDINNQIEIISDSSGVPSKIIHTKPSNVLKGTFETTEYTLKNYPEDFDILSAIQEGTIEQKIQDLNLPQGIKTSGTTIKTDGTLVHNEQFSRNDFNIQRSYVTQSHEDGQIKLKEYAYEIKDRNGEKLLDLKRSWAKNPDGTTTTIINGQEYNAFFDDSNLEIIITNPDGSKEILSLKDKTTPRMYEVLKNVPVDDLLTIHTNLKEIRFTALHEQAAYMQNDKVIKLESDNIGILSHELGHSIDFSDGNGERFGIISGNKELIDIYNKEIELFEKDYPELAQQIIKYFSKRGGGKESTGLAELVAETNMLLKDYGIMTTQHSSRGEYLVRYFPETIAKIAELLGY